MPHEACCFKPGLLLHIRQPPYCRVSLFGSSFFFIVAGLNWFGRGFWRIRVRYRMDGRLPRQRSAPVETRLRVLRLTGLLLSQGLPVRNLLVCRNVN